VALLLGTQPRRDDATFLHSLARSRTAGSLMPEIMHSQRATSSTPVPVESITTVAAASRLPLGAALLVLLDEAATSTSTSTSTAVRVANESLHRHIEHILATSKTLNDAIDSTRSLVSLILQRPMQQQQQQPSRTKSRNNSSRGRGRAKHHDGDSSGGPAHELLLALHQRHSIRYTLLFTVSITDAIQSSDTHTSELESIARYIAFVCETQLSRLLIAAPSSSSSSSSPSQPLDSKSSGSRARINNSSVVHHVWQTLCCLCSMLPAFAIGVSNHTYDHGDSARVRSIDRD